MKRPIIIAAVLAALSLTLLPSAAADDPSMQDRVDDVIQEHGGVQSGWNEVTWDDGAVVLTIEPRGGFAPFAVGTCATGTYCVYSGPNRTGSKIAFSTCANHSVSPLGGPVRSMANARSSGSVVAKNSSTVVLTVAVGGSKNTTATVTHANCA